MFQFLIIIRGKEKGGGKVDWEVSNFDKDLYTHTNLSVDKRWLEGSHGEVWKGEASVRK